MGTLDEPDATGPVPTDRRRADRAGHAILGGEPAGGSGAGLSAWT